MYEVIICIIISIITFMINRKLPKNDTADEIFSALSVSIILTSGVFLVFMFHVKHF